MLKLNHKEPSVLKAFNLDLTDWERIREITNMVCPTNTSRIIERLWIDETLTDEQKVFGIFSVGRAYQDELKKGGE